MPYVINSSFGAGNEKAVATIYMQDCSLLRCLSHQDAGYRYTEIIRTSGNKESFCVLRKPNRRKGSTAFSCPPDENSNSGFVCLFVCFKRRESLDIDLAIMWIFYSSNKAVLLLRYYYLHEKLIDWLISFKLPFIFMLPLFKQLRFAWCDSFRNDHSSTYWLNFCIPQTQTFLNLVEHWYKWAIILNEHCDGYTDFRKNIWI